MATVLYHMFTDKASLLLGPSKIKKHRTLQKVARVKKPQLKKKFLIDISKATKSLTFSQKCSDFRFRLLSTFIPGGDTKRHQFIE